MEVYQVRLSKQAERDLVKVPEYIALKLQAWIEDVGCRGIRAVRRVSGYHDEPLQGRRFGQRSIRLSRAYRAFYRQLQTGEIEFIQILEVNKHDY